MNEVALELHWKTSFNFRKHALSNIISSVLLTHQQWWKRVESLGKNRIHRVISQTGNWVVRRTSIIPRRVLLSHGRYLAYQETSNAEISSIPCFFRGMSVCLRSIVDSWRISKIRNFRHVFRHASYLWIRFSRR